MNKKTIVVLLILVSVFSFIGLWLGYSNTNDKQKIGQNTGVFLKDLSEQLSLANQITFSHYQNNKLSKISLKKQNENWLVKINKQDYYSANTAHLITFFSNLQKAKILETKTSNAKLYSRLAVDDIKPNAEGTLIEIKKHKDILYSLILGKQDSNNQGQFVRKSNEKMALLINQHIIIDMVQDNWIDKTIIKIKPDEIQKVEFQKNKLTVSRQTVTGTYQITHAVPLNKELTKKKIDGKINQLDFLNFVQLYKTSQINLPKQKKIVVYKKFNGDKITVKLYKKTEITKEDNFDAGDKKQKENEQKIEENNTYYLTLHYQSQSSTDVNKHYAKWVFEIPEYKYKSFDVSSNDLMQNKTNDADRKNQELKKQKVIEKIRKQINQ